MAAFFSLFAWASLPAHAWILGLTAGPKQLFLMVGVGTPAANNTTINTVSVTVPAANLGDGSARAMSSDSTQSASPVDNYAVCNPPAQVYIGGSYRQPNATTGAATATLQVTTPTALTSGTDTIPFSQISWTSTANGTATADIPAGTFTGGTQTLTTFARNTFVENCFTYSYANSALRAAGVFTGRAVFTLAVP
jgi:hypothetical protein